MFTFAGRWGSNVLGKLHSICFIDHVIKNQKNILNNDLYTNIFNVSIVRYGNLFRLHPNINILRELT